MELFSLVLVLVLDTSCILPFLSTLFPAGCFFFSNKSDDKPAKDRTTKLAAGWWRKLTIYCGELKTQTLVSRGFASGSSSCRRFSCTFLPNPPLCVWILVSPSSVYVNSVMWVSLCVCVVCPIPWSPRWWRSCGSCRICFWWPLEVAWHPPNQIIHMLSIHPSIILSSCLSMLYLSFCFLGLFCTHNICCMSLVCCSSWVFFYSFLQ